MDEIVREYMNPDLLYLREGDRPEIALRPLLEFGATAVPVLDDEHKPVGVVSIHDLADVRKEGNRISTDVVTVCEEETIASAARKVAGADARHAIVVDVEGRAVGMLSVLDIVRGLMGLEPRHPKQTETFGRQEARLFEPVEA